MRPPVKPSCLRRYVLEVVRRLRVHPASNRLRFAYGTVKGCMDAALRRTPPISALEDRWLALLVAGSTKVMGGLAAAHRFLQGIHHASGKRGCQFVALLLSIPVFHASNLIFKGAYFLNQRRLRCMCGEQGALGGEDLLVQFDGDGVNLGL